jgi:hypothetical protein
MVDQIGARELLLFIENDGDLYRSKFIPIVHNLQKKIKKGTFDLEKSIKMFMYLVDLGAKHYVAGSQDKWNLVFNKATRMAVAKQMAEDFVAEIEVGNFWD